MQRQQQTDIQERSVLSGRRCHAGLHQLLSVSGGKRVQRKLTAGRHSTSRPEQDRQLQLIQLHDRPHWKRTQQRENRKAGIQAPVCQNKVSSYTPRR